MRISCTRHRKRNRRAESDFQSRIHNILYPVGQAEQQMTQLSVPQTISAYDNSIIGTPLASQEQCVRYLLSNNPNPDITVSPQQLVSYYYEEGAREGIRPDVAFAQAPGEDRLLPRHGGDVIPQQNNFCGLGTTGGGVKGAFFATAQLGVRANIQHLLAYSSTREPSEPVIDPRYQPVARLLQHARSMRKTLNGRWAVPGYTYGQSILSMFRAMLTE